MNKEDKVMTYATAFCTVSAGGAYVSICAIGNRN